MNDLHLFLKQIEARWQPDVCPSCHGHIGYVIMSECNVSLDANVLTIEIVWFCANCAEESKQTVSIEFSDISVTNRPLLEGEL